MHEVLHLGRAPPHLPPRRPHLRHRRRALLGHEGGILIMQCLYMRHIRHMTREFYHICHHCWISSRHGGCFKGTVHHINYAVFRGLNFLKVRFFSRYFDFRLVLSLQSLLIHSLLLKIW